VFLILSFSRLILVLRAMPIDNGNADPGSCLLVFMCDNLCVLLCYVYVLISDVTYDKLILLFSFFVGLENGGS
jgi:hypothetical protein